MKVFLSTDHGGFTFKEQIKAALIKQGYDVKDFGAHAYDSEDDYPDFIFPMAEAVAADPDAVGITLGRSGNGEAIVCNKVAGVRCALCTNEEMAVKARQHNNANVLALSGDYANEVQTLRMVKTFLETEFPGEARHQRRIDKITAYEQKARG